MEPLISITFLTYNSSPEKVYLSLLSIVKQEYPRKELIISDDASSNTVFYPIVEKFIEKYASHFERIVFLKNLNNAGIVKNQKRAHDNCRGELITGLSPGDLFYCEKTLSELVSFYERNDKPLFFLGLQRSYYFDEKKSCVVDVDVMNPSPREIGLLEDPMKSFKRLLNKNFLSGASGFVYTKTFLSDKRFLLPETIQHLEDYTRVLLLTLVGFRIPVLQKYVRWYEYGDGISTTPQARRNQFILERDFWKLLKHIQNKFGDLLTREKEINYYVNRAVKVKSKQMVINHKLRKVRTVKFKRILKLFIIPERIGPYLQNKFITEKKKREIRKVREELRILQGEGFRSLIEKTLSEKHVDKSF